MSAMNFNGAVIVQSPIREAYRVFAGLQPEEVRMKRKKQPIPRLWAGAGVV